MDKVASVPHEQDNLYGKCNSPYGVIPSSFLLLQRQLNQQLKLAKRQGQGRVHVSNRMEFINIQIFRQI